jgi:hypothetical protein
MYFAARAITATVRITNAAICTQKLLVRPPLFTICVGMVDHLPLKKEKRREQSEKHYYAIAPPSWLLDFRRYHPALCTLVGAVVGA